MGIKFLNITQSPLFWKLHIGAGYEWKELVEEITLIRKIGGLENLAAVPGSVGGAAYQNVGAYGVEFKDFCDYVEIWDCEKGEMKRFECLQCQFRYRDSVFRHKKQGSFVIIAVGLKIPKKWTPVLTYGALKDILSQNIITPTEVYMKIIEFRMTRLPDPKKVGNAGSFFKNPVISESHLKKLLAIYPKLLFHPWEGRFKLFAGWLIDAIGLKNYCVGDAGLFEKNALVIVNRGNATGADVIRLVEFIQENVFRSFNIHLEPEVTMVGAQGKIN